MARYIDCDWCAASIEDGEDYSPAELNRMGLEDEDSNRYVVLEARFEGAKGSSSSRVMGHFHSPHCYQDALRLLGDHRAWAETRDAGRHGAAALRWDTRPHGAAPPEPPPVKRERTKFDMEAFAERDDEMRARARAGTPLTTVGVVPRAYRSLWRAGIACVEDLADHAEIDIVAVDGVGGNSLEKLRRALTELGLTFKADVATPAEFGERLRYLRQLSGHTADEIRRALKGAGMGDYQHLNMWERGVAAPTAEQREWLARYLGVERGELEEPR